MSVSKFSDLIASHCTNIHIFKEFTSQFDDGFFTIYQTYGQCAVRAQYLNGKEHLCCIMPGGTEQSCIELVFEIELGDSLV